MSLGVIPGETPPGAEDPTRPSGRGDIEALTVRGGALG
jgi:hypothetical protein